MLLLLLIDSNRICGVIITVLAPLEGLITGRVQSKTLNLQFVASLLIIKEKEPRLAC
jgi:hypothetical protein